MSKTVTLEYVGRHPGFFWIDGAVTRTSYYVRGKHKTIRVLEEDVPALLKTNQYVQIQEEVDAEGNVIPAKKPTTPKRKTSTKK